MASIVVDGACAEMIDDGERLHIKDLKSDGSNPYAFVQIMDKIIQASKGRTVRVVVQDSGIMERLVNIYARKGFMPIGIMMEGEF